MKIKHILMKTSKGLETLSNEYYGKSVEICNEYLKNGGDDDVRQYIIERGWWGVVWENGKVSKA